MNSDIFVHPSLKDLAAYLDRCSFLQQLDLLEKLCVLWKSALTAVL